LNISNTSNRSVFGNYIHNQAAFLDLIITNHHHISNNKYRLTE